MSIVSDSPRTRHQVAQLRAKQARTVTHQAAPTINRVFGAGIYPVAKLATQYDTYGNRLRTETMTSIDRAWWAAESAEIAECQDQAAIVAELREQDGRDTVMAKIEAEDRAWSDRENHEAKRQASYRW